MSDNIGPIERSGYKQTLLHNFPGAYGHKIKDGQHELDKVVHEDSLECKCNPIMMIWAPLEVWNEDMGRNSVVYRWVDKATYEPPVPAVTKFSNQRG